jgi:hypothetical protein
MKRTMRTHGRRNSTRSSYPRKCAAGHLLSCFEASAVLQPDVFEQQEEKLLEELLLKEDVFAGDTATEELVNNLTKQVQALDAVRPPCSFIVAATIISDVP